MVKKSLFTNMPQREAIEALLRRYPVVDAGTVEAYLAFLGLSGEITAAMEFQLAHYGTSQARLRVLIQLSRAEDFSLSPAALSERLGVKRATVTGLLDGLEAGGLIKRGQNARDGRAINVKLLPKGEKFLDCVIPVRYLAIKTLMSGLSSSETGMLLKLLKKMRGGLEGFKVLKKERITRRPL